MTGAYAIAGKRVFDVCAGGALLLAVLPVMAVLALLVRIRLGAPVLFAQQRPGLHGKPFVLYKFRSMTAGRAPDGTELPDEERLTQFGRFMRKFSLDELPQLWNVLRGNMSLVGPRPLLMDYVPLYSLRQARRHEVRPGVTGWTQVNGRNALTWEQKFEFDVWYVDHQSFPVDLKIIALTLLQLVRPSGISQEGSATMPRFTGTTRHD